MSKLNNTGVYQLSNGNWGFRYAIVVDGKRIDRKRNVDEYGNPYKTKTSAVKARQAMMERERNAQAEKKVIIHKTVTEVYNEYCEFGRAGKAYGTIKKQESLWNNHIKAKFGKRYVDDITSAEINDYLTELYYTDNRAYSYTESFLKLFYLIFGQAYSRNYLGAEQYDRLCKNKDTKIHMPKMKVDEETDIITFTDEQMIILSEYFKGTNTETAFMLGKYCGLCINECYGLKWSNIDFKNDIIKIDRQMQYQDGVIKLVSLKTRNARREIIIESYSGAKERPLFNQILKQAQQDDYVVVTKLDRFCRSTKEGVEYIDLLINKGVKIHILNMGLIENTPMGRLIVTNLLAFAEFERAMIIERTQGGKAIAKQRADFKEGRPKKYNSKKISHALELLQSYSYRQVEEMTGISKSTLIRAKRKHLVLES